MIGTKKLGVASQNTAYRFGCKALAVALAVALATPMTGAPWASQALADDGVGETSAVAQTNNSGITIRGVDFMQPSAEGAWELLRVDGAEGQNLYIDIIKDGNPIAVKYRYTVPSSADVNDATDPDLDSENPANYAGEGENKIAHIIELDMSQNKEAMKLGDTFGDPAKAPVYTIKVYTAKIGADALYEGQIYPVYAKLNVEPAADATEEPTPEYRFLGIRTRGEMDTFANTIGAGTTYYLNDTAFEAEFVDASRNPVVVNEGNCFVISYAQVPKGATSGAVKYVDVDGNVIRTDPVLNVDKGVDVEIERSFFTPDGKYYRVIDRLTGAKVHLDKNMAAKQVRVMEVKAATANAYQVTINYVDEKGTTLWTDSVNVKGKGYKYTLPNIFSMSSIVDKDGNVLDNAASRDQLQWGVQQYELAAVTTMLEDGTIVKDEPAASENEGATEGENAAEGEDATENEAATEPEPEPEPEATAQAATQAATENESATEGEGATEADAAKQVVDPVVTFPASSQGNRVVTAQYKNKNADQDVLLYIVEIDGETGKEIGRVTEEVTPFEAATYTPEAKTVNGKKYVPWSGNVDTITYAWEDLQKGADLMQYVYYVSEDYVPGNAYDVTVQYMNIANSQVIRTDTVSIDPEITDFVEILGPETFSDGGNDYVRLAGQETAIRHAFLSPTRTYTIYYRDVNDELSANITIRRTQIIDTDRVETIPGTTVVAAPVAGNDGTVDAGVGAGDGAAVINDDDNPLTNQNGQDTATERTIADEENPLFSGTEPGSETSLNSGLAIAAGAVAALLAVIGIVLFLLARKRKKQEPEPALAEAANTDHTNEA